MTSVLEVTLAQVEADRQLALDVVAVWEAGERRPRLDVLIVLGMSLTKNGARYGGVLEGAEIPAECFTASRDEYRRREMDLAAGEPVSIVVWAPALATDGETQRG